VTIVAIYCTVEILLLTFQPCLTSIRDGIRIFVLLLYLYIGYLCAMAALCMRNDSNNNILRYHTAE